MTETPPLAAAVGISKRFYATQALDDVSFEIPAGEVHALIGENGAGKSTLMKILGGVHQADSGEIRVDGQAVEFGSPAAAQQAGVVVIPQEMRVLPAQTVAENVLLGQVPVRTRFGVLKEADRAAMRSRAAELVGRLNLKVDADTLVGQLGYAERQLVMIARALGRSARVLVLDEPTAALETREVTRLFDVIEGLKNEGVGLVYVSHRLDEVERISDRVTVLRDGRKVGEGARDEFSQQDMIRLMTGRDLEETLHHDERPAPGAVLLDDPDVSVREGEIVGLAGLLGSGTTEMLRRLYGARKPSGGGVYASPSEAISDGLGLVPGERGLGLVMALTVRENIILPNLDRFSTRWGLDKKAIDALVGELMETVDIRPRDPDKLVRDLSGGNQQKVIFARWLAGHVKALLLDEPTHGIDVGAKAQIHRLMSEFAAKGGGIVFASSEMVEVLSISDSVIAMRTGDVVARLTRDGDYTERALREALGG
ncbi:MAG: sugar ABC transporter ATP-binding protein [Alphaproteobacteria bacterium]